ncbi:hypothetical protein HLV37_07365 [Eggerthellaceae bacterium zg-1084]|uniref:Uncharacterized protein n=1 Tax=Berryella wangjianweii TaxID=2734634 RepID=A0A6M8J8K6_9ACTN|nr:hypothetical protein [Berryella wangjianweii]NPD31669.1 hypothetical protein [Berryella wangjianweii]NPD32836.1 hypothetical protein [Eggerthellaceae bacterium zg-997]QKF07719.1 hypothetical protein HLV38_06055 [Berryella wangjianweii]
MSEARMETSDQVTAALNDADVLTALVESLEGSSRRARQTASSTLALVARENPSLLVPYADNLIDALNRPEAQTRWECIDALALLVPEAIERCDAAVVDVEAALFDEGNGSVRLSAVRFLCKLGAADPARSDVVWPLLDEAIQCYHGDLEFTDMLGAIAEFASGALSVETRAALIERLSFDATNGKGALKKKAASIIDIAQAAS